MYLLSTGFSVVSVELAFDKPVVVFTSFEESVKTKLKRLIMGSNRKSSPSPGQLSKFSACKKYFQEYSLIILVIKNIRVIKDNTRKYPKFFGYPTPQNPEKTPIPKPIQTQKFGLGSGIGHLILTLVHTIIILINQPV